MVEQKIQQLNKFKIERENTIQYPIKELLKDSINEWLLSDIQQILHAYLYGSILHTGKAIKCISYQR